MTNTSRRKLTGPQIAALDYYCRQDVPAALRRPWRGRLPATNTTAVLLEAGLLAECGRVAVPCIAADGTAYTADGGPRYGITDAGRAALVSGVVA